MAQALQTYQKAHCQVYGRYRYEYLPIAAFKHAPITCFPPEDAECVFESSGTTNQHPSRHYVRYLDTYDRSIREHFLSVFGPGPFTFVVHLPGYASLSSLVYMARRLVEWFGDDSSGFFLQDRSFLERAIAKRKNKSTPFILLGAAFGLLDLVESQSWHLPPGSRVIETGGMKTHRREITREALHQNLAQGFGIPRNQVLSEYGMCEMLTQAYSRGGHLYYPPPWMKVNIFDPENPLRRVPNGEVGVIGVVDLANVYSVSAIMTEDLGVARSGGFEVLGRLSNSELRGCNYLLPPNE